MNIILDIKQISDELTESTKDYVIIELNKIIDFASKIGKSWSGSWMGYHSKVYYKDFQIPPPGAHFSPMWGLKDTTMFRETIGDWVEYDFDKVVEFIYRNDGNLNLELYKKKNSKN